MQNCFFYSPCHNKTKIMRIPEAAETSALGRHLLTIDNSKAKVGRGGRPLPPEASQAKLRVQAGSSSSVGRSCECTDKCCQGGCMGGEQWMCCLKTALQMNTDALMGGAGGAARGLKTNRGARNQKHLNESSAEALLQRSFTACCSGGNYAYAGG